MQDNSQIGKIVRQTLVLLVFTLAFASICTAIQPSAPDSVANTSFGSPALGPGTMINSSGGSIYNLTINATTNDERWKGFVGRVNGVFALEDSSSSSIFSWDISNMTGELYATRSSSMPNWTEIKCANSTLIGSEEAALNITSASVDSINSTFSLTSHKMFYAGTEKIEENSCRSVALNVNGTKQSTKFKELLLQDNSNVIYTSLLENRQYGFNNQTYDFEMIVPEIALEGNQVNTAYYLYIELI